MLHKPVLSGRIGKWAYSLKKYNLKYEPLRATKGQVVADFVVDHMITDDKAACLVETIPWRLFFDGSVCNRGRVVGCVIVSPNGMCYELSIRLEFACTNNQAEYKGLLHELEFLREMGAKEVEASGDSSIVVQQIKGETQCWNVVLNSYRDKCLELIKTLETFHIKYIPREKNKEANALAQQASGYEVKRGLFVIKSAPTNALIGGNHYKLVDMTLVVETVGSTGPTM
jgi:ribonuclease HI